MQLGMIGLGRMGGGMTRRLMRAGHELVVWDINQRPVEELVGEGARGAATLEDLVRQLDRPRHVWLMLPAAFVDSTIGKLAPLLDSGDVIIDGGNSHYHHDIRRAQELGRDGLRYVDVGVSGGVWGLERGYCHMIGGEDEVVARLDPIFRALAPGVDAAPRTPGREGEPGPAEKGYLHCGPAGAGHFVKMVHNGIEYGVMAAYAEGFNVLKGAGAGLESRSKDAETTPLDRPEHYQYSFDMKDVSEVWRRGSVIGSWLLDLTAQALTRSPQLEEFSGHVSDSGEGRWTILAAVDEGVPCHVLSAAVFDRFESRGRAEFANKVLSAMRFGFGGHHEKKTD